jgi:hypothetical protein
MTNDKLVKLLKDVEDDIFDSEGLSHDFVKRERFIELLNILREAFNEHR